MEQSEEGEGGGGRGCLSQCMIWMWDDIGWRRQKGVKWKEDVERKKEKVCHWADILTYELVWLFSHFSGKWL